MIRPDIRTYHEDWGEHIGKGRWRRDHFRGKSPRDFYEKRIPTNIKSDGVLFEMDLALPGFEKEEIEVKVEDNILTITAQKTKQEIPDNRYVVQEFDVETMQRRFQLANIVSHDKINASFKNGVLKLIFKDCCDVTDEEIRRIVVN